MEGHGGDTLIGCIIVLDEPFTSNVPNFNGLVGRSRRDASAIGVELYTVDWKRVVGKALNEAFGSDVPQLDLLIL